MESINKIKSKSVGQVRIFEISGNFMGDFARHGEQAIRNTMKNKSRNCALFNLCDVKGIDEMGVKVIVNNSDNISKAGIFVKNQEIRELFLRLESPASKMKVLEDDFEVSSYFSREFAERSPEEELLKDRRQFVRLRTILPLKFSLQRDEKNLEEFFSIITNLSEGGLFAEYIHSKSEDKAKRWLSTSDGQLLDVLLFFTKTNLLHTKARITHGDPFGGGVGMEFLGMSEENKAWIRDWIAEHLMRFSQS